MYVRRFRGVHPTMLMRHIRELPIFGLVLLISTGCGTHVHVGAGLGRGGTSVGGESNSAVGPVLSLRAAVPDRRVGVLTAVDVQPFRVEHPYADEAFRLAYLIPSLQVKTGPVMVRGGLGLAFSSWTGSERISAFEAGPALSAEVEVPVGGGQRVGWLVGLSLKGAGTSDGEMSMSLLSLHLARRLF